MVFYIKFVMSTSINWTLLCLVLCVVWDAVYLQCDENGNCECHCTCCTRVRCPISGICTACDWEWSGSTSNGCQRKNIAYERTTKQKSTEYPSSNAVDENKNSFARTKYEENPWLAVTLDKIYEMKYMLIDIAGTGRFVTMVKNSSSKPETAIKCDEVSIQINQRTNWSVTCRNNQVLTGDQVVIVKETDGGTLNVIDIRIFQCSAGTYGYFCDKKCNNCLENQCNGFTGVCIIGCKNSWYGDICDKRCPLNCESSCDRYLGCISCFPGFTGDSCSKCITGTFGKNCGFTCTNCRPEFCNNTDGCYQCSRGFYGLNCIDSCPDHCRNDECNKESGFCSYGCEDGFMGLECKIPCSSKCATCDLSDRCSSCVDGMYGQQCELPCPQTCGGEKTCDKNKGHCEECMAGRYDENCTELCSANCNSSTCERDGKCIGGCNEGWLGLNCSIKCSEEYCSECILTGSAALCKKCEEGYYLDIEKKCMSCPSNCLSCENALKCTRCKDNFTGYLCNEDCNTNCIDHLCEMNGICTYGCNNRKYGTGCSNECAENCERCHDSFNCIQCSPGYYGRYCFLCHKNCYNCTSNSGCLSCKPGFYGRYCQSSCPSECVTCNVKDFCTSCREGWSGRSCECNVKCNDVCGYNGKCQNGCKGSFYGDFCNVSCPSENCQSCDQKFGNCTKCKEGLYGILCDMDCSRTCVGSVCDIGGECSQGCEEGFTGEKCRKTCNPGRYGTDCKEKCGHCESNETCHHVNGSCPGLCEPGYHGEKCLTVCQKGFYGRNCSSPCGHCAKNATCDHVTGSCPSGYCEPGWKYTPEQRCNQACNNGWYGVECKESCGYCRGNKACHHVNGSCFGLCEPGYHGEKCENSEFSQLLAIQRKMLEFVRELLTRKRSKAELKENGTSPTDFK